MFVRQVSRQARQAVRTVRTYATEAAAAKVELDQSIAKHLKPEVVKAIDSKTDQLLIRKLNFVGPAIAVRLNTANKIVLQSLSQENCLRILTEELSDPWDYYWLNVKENGSDPQLWLASLNEVKDLPWVAARCWIQMQRNGVFPKVEHYNTFFYTLGLVGDSAGLHDQFDALKRRNVVKSKPTEETYNMMLNMWINKGSYPMAKMAEDLVKFRGFTVRPENAQKVEELGAKFDAEAAFQYFLGNLKEEPACVKEAREKNESLKQHAKDLIEAYYQPAIENLIVRE
jgi:hypothetical protein